MSYILAHLHDESWSGWTGTAAGRVEVLALALMLEGYRDMADAPASTQCGQAFR